LQLSSEFVQRLWIYPQQGAPDNAKSQPLHPDGNIDWFSGVCGLTPAVHDGLGFLGHNGGKQTEVLLTKSLLREPPLMSPELSFASQQALPLQGSNRLKERPFAVIASVIAQDVLYGIRVAYQVKRVGPEGQADHIAKLAAERQAGSQRLVLQRSPALPEGVAPWAGYMVEMLRYMRHCRRLFIK
jgi:hypothetical protein